MDVNDNAQCLDKRGALGFFASKLAPTGIALRQQIAAGPSLAEQGNPNPFRLSGVAMSKVIQPLAWFVVLSSVLAVASGLSLGLV